MKYNTKIITKMLVIITSLILVLNSASYISYASDSGDFFAQYSGSTEASWGYKPNCTFTINKIVDNRFRGRFAASNLGSYSFNEAVEGKAYTSGNSITCIFTVKFYNNRYYSNIVATVNMLEGTCECFCVGSWHMEDFVMTGTKFSYPTNYGVGSEFSAYSEEDMKICMALSDAIYDFKSVSDNEFLDITKNYGIDKENNETSFYNMLDSNADNVAFAITNRENSDGSIDMFVVLRGTLKDEWQGNTEVTGTSFDESILVHDNFNKAKESIKSNISKYYSRMKEKSDTVNLIITGHSRGAAVANLYAKEATDKSADIPDFNNVTAYTFACPNVEKYNSTMENYKNIFNFCFKEDVVPTVPLTSPVNGWNYWKYGQTYMANLSDYNNDINDSAVKEIHNALSLWSNVNAYYNLPVVSTLSVSGLKSTTLYDVAHDLTGTFMSYGAFSSRRFISASKVLLKIDAYPVLFPLIYGAVKNANSIRMAHHYDSYNNLINGTNSSTAQSDSVFYNCSYNGYLNMVADSVYKNDIAIQSESTYNPSQIELLTSFYNSNADILDWDIDDPSTWTGIEWDSNGNVESIDLSFKNLSGSLDLSNFSSLKSLNLSGNNLNSVNLDNCSSLEELDCSFNKLGDLDLSDCTNLTSVTCCYNYLDTHEGSTLYNKLDDLMFSDCYVNYYPQSVPDNATFDTTELNVLKTFANTNNNNTALNWLDDSGNIDTEKLQNNILFEYDGSKYRVVAIDISDLDISGALDLTSLSLLQELYCENTKITTLNIKGCTKLETLKCDGCELTSITLPSNANAKTSSLYDVSCEYNYLDTSIFTQDVIKYVEFKAGGEIQYKNQKGDSSALQAALYFANKLDEKDYSEETFTSFKELIDECNAYNYDNLYLTQEDIDEITTNILVSMYELKAYFKVNISSSNGSFTVNDEKSSSSYKQSLLYGTTVTLNTVPNEGYNFVGWYDTVNNIYMSKNPEYTFKVSTNTDLKAVFIAEGLATLTFVNHSNWVAGTFTKSTAEWAEVTSINDLLPEVPFRFGYSNGRWVYDEQDVLTRLQNGEDVTITAEYDEDDTSFPEPRQATDKPVLDLYYKYNEENTLGTFMMAAGFPENIKVESVGIAFYYKKADLFDPRDNFTLLLNNKMMIGRFNTEQLEDIYIINMHNMTSTYNWAARGFVTYYDSNGNLVTEYSNQINIIDRQNTDEIK